MNPTTPSPNYAESILAAGKQLGQKVEVVETPTGPFMVVPNGLQTVDLIDKAEKPRHLRQGVTVTTVNAFVDYVRLFAGTTQRPVVFADLKDEGVSTILAILDYHAGPADPSWNQHRVTFPMRFASAFQEWHDTNGEFMGQLAFARFLERHIPEIAEPGGAVLSELSLAFEAEKRMEFKSYHRLDNGDVQFTYNETVQDNVRAGAMKMPPRMTLVMPIFEDMPAVSFTAQIRYRIEAGGKLVLAFEIDHLDYCIAQQERAVAEHVRTQLAGVVRGVIVGRPE